jgi:hypothetical protein
VPDLVKGPDVKAKEEFISWATSHGATIGETYLGVAYTRIDLTLPANARRGAITLDVTVADDAKDE